MVEYDIDQGMVDTLKNSLDEFNRLRELQAWRQEAWEAVEAQFKHVYHKELAELDRLENRLKGLHQALQYYVDDRIMHGGESRRAFIGGLVRVQVRRRVQEGYDEEAMKAWAEQYDVLSLPKDIDPVVTYLLETNKSLLTPDIKQAAKLALLTDDDGQPVFSDNPATVEEYVTVISSETFLKTLSTLALEKAFDDRRESNPDGGE